MRSFLWLRSSINNLKERLHSQTDDIGDQEPEAKKPKLQENEPDQEKYFSVMFYKFTKKKNKTFDDGNATSIVIYCLTRLR